MLDSELAALLWLLLETGLPLVVSGRPPAARDALAVALEQLAEADDTGNGEARRQLWLLDEESLADVFASLSAPPTAFSDDQLRGLGLVLIVGAPEGAGRRLLAAHYVRPPERDAAGHVQRRPPGLLAAWDGSQDRLEHYAWGIMPELADRAGRPPADFDEDHHRRRRFLDEQVSLGVDDAAALRAAASEFRRGARH